MNNIEQKLNLKMIKEISKTLKDYDKDEDKRKPYIRNFNSHIDKLKKFANEGADINYVLNTIYQDEKYYKVRSLFLGEQPQSLVEIGLDAEKLDEKVRDEFYYRTSFQIENNKDLLNINKNIITLSTHPSDLLLLHTRKTARGCSSVLAKCELGEMLLNRGISSQALKYQFLVKTITEIFSLFCAGLAKKPNKDDLKSLYNYFAEFVQMCPINQEDALREKDPYIRWMENYRKPTAYLQAFDTGSYYVGMPYAKDEEEADNIFPFYKLLLDKNCPVSILNEPGIEKNCLDDKFQEYFENQKQKQSITDEHSIKIEPKSKDDEIE